MRFARIPVLLLLLAAFAGCGDDSPQGEEAAAPVTDPLVDPADVPPPPDAETPDFVEGDGEDTQPPVDTTASPPSL